MMEQLQDGTTKGNKRPSERLNIMKENFNQKLDEQDDTKFGNHDVTSQMSSINQSLLDGQPSNAISRSFVDLEQESSNNRDEAQDIKEAIIDLYLAIKIRSTEELDKINDGNLKTEKEKLIENVDSFQILEYIRSSIEIIMNLKIEDLERNDGGKTANKKKGESIQDNEDVKSISLSEFSKSNIGVETSISGISVESKNLIQ